MERERREGGRYIKREGGREGGKYIKREGENEEP